LGNVPVGTLLTTIREPSIDISLGGIRVFQLEHFGALLALNVLTFGVVFVRRKFGTLWEIHPTFNHVRVI
jgi:hypothetical protein